MDFENGGEDFMNKSLLSVYRFIKVSLKLQVIDAKSMPKPRDKPRAYSK
tara:strand:+ start:86 stop:232 length:147 start_codon:yes stop_codon:yes gene_type:complete